MSMNLMLIKSLNVNTFDIKCQDHLALAKLLSRLLMCCWTTKNYRLELFLAH